MKTTIHLQAMELRASGVSVIQIAKQLGVAKSSVSIWTRNVPLSEDAKITLRNNSKRAASAMCQRRNVKCREVRQQARNDGLALDLTDPLITTGLALYWGEGNKKSGFTALTNGDPDLIATFLRFLREKMDVSDDKIIVRITTHSQEQLLENEPFWLKHLNLPVKNLRRGTIVAPGKKKTGKCLYGMCRVEIYDVRLIEKILGGIDAMRRSNNGNSQP